MKGRGVRSGRVPPEARSPVVACVVAAGLLLLTGAAAAGAASAAPLDRAGDPVVFKGSDVPGLLGSKPGRIVAFAWRSGWKQVPVQVDERVTIDVRDLYPTPSPPYVRVIDTGFPLEVYADPDTRTGADTNPGFDAGDEVALMAQDVGTTVASGKVKRPRGTTGPAAQVTIEDPLSARTGAVYLFRAERGMDQSAGRSYVDYDFRPLYLQPGQKLRDGYRYLNSANPEDSTVSTAFYEIHSTDRWMDDEVRVRAAGADGTDILDREVAQATRRSCGRSELTFSGNWTTQSRGGDTDEGTFVTVKAGPIRAIRDYMGANSGPYTQRQHVYYERREDTTTFLRVHPMLDLYTWTDWAASASGMTYRNELNQDGVTVDGSPDTLAQPVSSDFSDGSTFWEMISGEQGSVATIASVETDIPDPNFGSYYLDDANAPLTGDRLQCAGDGLSYGASGFGILGPVTPNTDPRFLVFNSLTVKRSRYFASPDTGVDQATRLADRVASPLEVSSAVFRPRAVPELSATIRPLRARMAGRDLVRVTVAVRNTGDAAARGVRVCVIPDDGSGVCRVRKSLGAGRIARVTVPARLPGVRPGAPVWAVLRVSAKGAEPLRQPYRLVARSR